MVTSTLSASLGRALRSAARYPRRPLRSFATAAHPQLGLQTTTLPNGLTVATETHPHAQTATVGVWIDAGSRAETDATNGTAHFLEHMAFKGTKRRSQHQLELSVESLGAHLNAYTSREQTVYYAKCFSKDVGTSGVGWSSPDYFPMLVMQSIFGNWDRSLGAQGLMSSRLSHIISSNQLANSYMSFSTSYSDTGLWGIYLVTENLMNMDDMTHFTLKEWTRMSIAPTEVEVERAKSQLKASLLLTLDGTTAIAEDIGRQLVTSGRRMTPKQIEFAVDSVTVDDIKRVAQKYLWDKDIAIAAVGPLDGLLDYNRIRADMSSLLY
ncbi:LuxS/MPP-like metallohydrolase [Trametes sanguinea]|nr:LuxS/MPP-like metallohydrolase [Trametes sanguinea]